MTDRVKDLLADARQVQETFQLNVTGISLAVLQETRKDAEEIEHDTEDQIMDSMLDIIDEYVDREFKGCDGHMSRRNIAVLQESCRELCRGLLEENLTWTEIQDILTKEAFHAKV